MRSAKRVPNSSIIRSSRGRTPWASASSHERLAANAYGPGMELANRVVVVTGGGSGIGAGLAMAAAQAGARHVVVADLDGDAAQTVATSVGGTAVALDVRDEAAVAHGPLTHDQAMRLQSTELDRTLELLHSLEPADWSAPTDSPAWDVHRMYLHVLGACEAGASMKE